MMSVRWQIVTIILAFAGYIQAHDLYLNPSSFFLNEPGTVELEMRLEESRFPGDPVVWRGSKTVQFKMIGPGGNHNLVNTKESNPSITIEQNGIHQIGWQSDVTYISIEPALFNEYIALEGYKTAIAARKKNANTRGRERYSRFIKTYVQVGAQKTEDYKKPLGFKIEIIPSNNPAFLKVGDEIEVQLLYDGKPLPRNRMMATHENYSAKPDDYAQTVVTDRHGKARFKITNPGVWLIRSNRMIAVKGDPKADWESFWSNISFQVKAD
jgi:uncharacterized GH25 family protein